MLTELTKEQEALCDTVAQEYIDDLTKPTPPESVAIQKWLDVAYRLFSLPCPKRVEVMDSPQAALKLASALLGEKQTSLDWCGVGESGWVAFYDYFHRIGVLKDDEVADIFALRDYSRVAWDIILLDGCAIVVRRPTLLQVDAEGNLHAAGGPCIVWNDGEKDYAWHGTWVPERMILDPRSYTAAEYKAITNTEERRALSEIAGWDWVADLLGSSIINEWTDPTTKLAYQLLTVSDGQKFLRKQSPLLVDGSQPWYLEPVHEDLKTAAAARKWQATTLMPAECEHDPHLVYGVES